MAANEVYIAIRHLQGQIDDCTCNVDTVDHYNNNKIYPRLYFRVNLLRPCPFWPDDSKCASEDCSIKPCEEEMVPPGLKPNHHVKYNELTTNGATCAEDRLGYLNTSIRDGYIEEFEKWRIHDDKQDNFCEFDDEKSAGMQYVDLLLNPESYTGYKGPSAHQMQLGNNLEGLCLEKRVFFRAISGIHASINIHLSANYFTRDAFGSGSWGPNINEFTRRFSPETTKGEGPNWLKNLYFVYLLELRALAKATPYLKKELYFTGYEEKDQQVRQAMNDILVTANGFPNHFNESTMFAGKRREAKKLKEEFKLHFRNISRIMDCVGCDKCKLWGKLQVQGLGTAFKILFSGDNRGFSLNQMRKDKFQLQRTEIVALINGLGRLSSSIQILEKFRNTLALSNAWSV
uniref:Uncharacterized protein n=1 Tax=Strigamia maritima TaxID=126957 RepID=T1JKR4_STRMM